MHPPSIPIYGEQPELHGTWLEGLLLEGFVANGELVSAANSAFFCIAGTWYRLSLDAGTVHWRRQARHPLPWSVPEQGWSYPHTDIGSEHGLTETPIEELVSSQSGDTLRVEVLFQSGRRLVLIERDDRTSYYVA